ncbi:MAG: SWIM zinc finger family protein [Sedimentisphaerales bacterium]|nr:SWIM zinc finger family protein [Sedimentisphaerales bacterium]
MNTENYVEILVKSSSGNPYKVRFYLEQNEISAFCSCPAGDNRKLCKHVKRIIAGDDSIIFDINQKNVLLKIGSHLERTSIPILLSELSESEIVLENAQKNLKKAKKALEKVVLKK